MVIITEQQKIALEKFAAQAVLDMKLTVRTKRISNNRQSPLPLPVSWTLQSAMPLFQMGWKFT